MNEQLSKKPTYRDLLYDEGATLLDMWQFGTRLDPGTLNDIWNGSLVPRYVAEQVLNEYNQLFGTHHTLDQVNIPTLEALGYGRRFQVREGEMSMSVTWRWEQVRCQD